MLSKSHSSFCVDEGSSLIYIDNCIVTTQLVIYSKAKNKVVCLVKYLLENYNGLVAKIILINILYQKPV